MQGRTAFFLACGSGSLPCVEILLAATESASAVARTTAATPACRRACINQKDDLVHPIPENVPNTFHLFTFHLVGLFVA